MNYALEVSELQKVYPKFQLEHFNLKLPQGCIMGLIGENGAGKSTALKTILHLVKKEQGDIRFWGKEWNQDSNQIKEDIGVVFDEVPFQEQMTPKRLGRVGKQAYKQWNMELYTEYLDRFAIDPYKKVKELSRGMKMKLCLAMALGHQPKLLLLDEATSGLDPVVRDEILDVFLGFVQDEQHSVLLSTHITSDLEKIADYITFLHKGKIILCKEKDELIYQYGIMRCKNTQFQNLDMQDVEAYRKEEYQWDVLVKDRKMAEKKYKDVVIDTPTLEEIMLINVKGERV